MVSVQGRSGVSIDGPRREGKKKTGTDPLVRPLVFIVIPLMIRQVGRNQCVLASAALRSALCSSMLELWDGLLPAAHRFSSDPERSLPQRLTKFLSPHFPNFAQETSSTHQPTAPPVALPITSYLISTHNGKIRAL